jgi:hypothetical protein
MGKTWFREAFGQEAQESEIAVMARRHQSVTHGVGILEARDYLQAAGCTVVDDPAAILSVAEERWGTRTEPDLIVVMDSEAWPVEVQREVSERLLTKWAKSLATAGRLALVLFNEEHRRRQHAILERARRELPVGAVRLTSLEAMETQEWCWMTFPHR